MTAARHAAAMLALAACLGGCATREPPLYQWERYQAQVYQYLKGGSADPQQQIAVLEEDFQKVRSQNRLVPPGFHAHLGMLYAATGRDDRALEEFRTEKTNFPESARYMDMLLDRASGTAAAAATRQDKEP